MSDQRIIYMDVGCWQGKEEQQPTMTFGLIEHNSVALCTFYSNGERQCKTYYPNGGNKPGIPFMIKEFEYDFNKTLINKFLTEMMEKKYGTDFIKYRSEPSMKDFHIIKLIPFPRRTLLDDETKLLIIIPDIHLHYFKLSYLDNFITWFGNKWESGKPVSKKLPNRISMEGDFSIFLNHIADFQRRGKAEGNAPIGVLMLGDMYEMWETRSVVERLLLFDNEKRYYEDLHKLIEWLLNRFKGEGDLRKFLKELYDLRISELPTDPLFQEQISSLRKDQKTLKKLYINHDESLDTFKEKADYLKNEILKQYSDKNGKSFADLLDDIKATRITFPGNHDNFLGMSTLDPLYSFQLARYEPPSWRFNINYSYKNTDFLFMHGHNLDQHNNDESCGTGYAITSLLTLFEAKQRGDLLKHYESILAGDAHLDYIKKLAPILYKWDQEGALRSKKNIAIMHAHTHKPYLEDITNQYRIYRYVKSALPPERPVINKWVKWFFELRGLLGGLLANF